MKRLAPTIFIILFPYSVVLLLCSFFYPNLMKCLFHNNFYLALLYLFVFWFLSLISAILICIKNFSRKQDALASARTNMMIKLAQIPAYLFIFLAGFVCMLTIFTFIISFVLMILDCASILLSGIVGVSAVKRSHAEGILSTNESVLHGILQFLFCADCISSIIVFKKAKAAAVLKNSVEKNY